MELHPIITNAPTDALRRIDALILIYAQKDPDTLSPEKYFETFRALEYIRKEERKTSLNYGV